VFSEEVMEGEGLKYPTFAQLWRVSYLGRGSGMKTEKEKEGTALP